MFYDESAQTYFRRLCFSPEGSFLFTPAALFKPVGEDAGAAVVPTVYSFACGKWEAPVFHLPGPAQAKVAVAVRCSPKLYKLKPVSAGGTKVTDLPYRIVIAVATGDSVLVYDTQHIHPIAAIRSGHCSTLTDVSWSHDGLQLFASGNDGYCSQVQFAEGELGETLSTEELPAVMQREHTATFARKVVAEEVAVPTMTASTAGSAADGEQPSAAAAAAATAAAAAQVSSTATAHTPGPKTSSAVSSTPLNVDVASRGLPAKTPMNAPAPSSMSAPSPTETMAEAPPEDAAEAKSAPAPTTEAALGGAGATKINILQPKKKRRIAPTLVQ
jgi:chromatin assembly factor 1 subunit B